MVVCVGCRQSASPNKKSASRVEMNFKRVCISLMVLIAVTGSALAAGRPNVRMLTPDSVYQTPAAQPPQEELDAYKAWYDANNANDMEKAYPLAKAFVAKYANNTNKA